MQRMFTVSKNKFLERLDALPESIRNLAFSLEIGGVLQSIADAHHLDQKKTDKVLALTAAVFFGFIHRTDLAREIEQGANLDTKIAQSITEEIGRKVFSRVETELDEFYQPALAGEDVRETRESSSPESKPRGLGTPSFLRFKDRPSSVLIPASAGKGASPSNAPFVLHEEKALSGETRKESMRGFSLPFGLFKPKQGEFAPAPRATIETPSDAKAPASKPTKEEGKVVHYSEYRTNLSPGTGGEFINLETFGKTLVAPKVAMSPLIPEQPSTQTKETPLQIKKSESLPPLPKISPLSSGTGGLPNVEGNVVDLR
ncbi:MAG: hypothetical protein V1885_02910 [Candidatus Brennerbacteria bacterium]